MAGMRRGAMVLLLAGGLLSGCSTAPVTQECRRLRTKRVRTATGSWRTLPHPSQRPAGGFHSPITWPP